MFISRLLFFFTFFSIYLTSFSQYYEIGIFGGGSYYVGDINPNKHFAMTKLAVGGVIRYNFDNHWTARVNVFQGTLTADDAVIKHHPERNLHFKTSLTEIGTILELNFFPYQTGTRNNFTPFIFGGAAFFKFNPKAEFENEWYNLQPLGTEGQGTTAYPDKKPYRLGAIGLPFGVGIKYSFKKNISISAEWGIRKTLTDYIDDVSTSYADPDILAAENTYIAAAIADRRINENDNLQFYEQQRGDHTNNDWYSFFGITVSMQFSVYKDKCHGMPQINANHKR